MPSINFGTENLGAPILAEYWQREALNLLASTFMSTEVQLQLMSRIRWMQCSVLIA